MGCLCRIFSEEVWHVSAFAKELAFEPEDIAKMSAAFESALHKLGLADRSDPGATAVAKLIIEFAKTGERDPEWLCDLALQQLSK